MASSISANTLYPQLGMPAAPVMIDVRREEDFAARPRLLPGARRGDPERTAQWAKTLPRARPVMVYCAHGRRVSQAAAETLAALGFNASYLDGGIDAWIETGHAT